MRIPDNQRAWLEESGLVDDNVDLEAVRLKVGGFWTWYLRLQRMGAITHGDSIWYRNEEKRADLDLLVHELVHVGQYRELGRLGFLRQYAVVLIRARGYNRNLPLEKPAYERQKAARELLRERPLEDS